MKKNEWIKYAAIGLAGVYLFNRARESGKNFLAGDGVSMGGKTFKINPESLVDAVMPFAGLDDRTRDYASLGLKEFFRGLRK